MFDGITDNFIEVIVFVLTFLFKQLISALAHTFGSEGCTVKFLPIVESMINDSMFYVRKEAAAAISSLSAALDPKVTLEKLVSKQQAYTFQPIFLIFCFVTIVTYLYQTLYRFHLARQKSMRICFTILVSSVTRGHQSNNSCGRI